MFAVITDGSCEAVYRQHGRAKAFVSEWQPCLVPLLRIVPVYEDDEVTDFATRAGLSIDSAAVTVAVGRARRGVTGAIIR
jgi:hypothetical protein